jgi:hypothetical protein
VNYGIGETILHYAFCKYEGCNFVTDDYESKAAAEADVLEHLEEDHGDDGE